VDVGVGVNVPVGGDLMLVGVLVWVIVALGVAVAGVPPGVIVRVGVGGGTAGRAAAMAATNPSTVLSIATASPTVAQLPFSSAFWKAVSRAAPAFVKHA
jgi:hypothetical protein